MSGYPQVLKCWNLIEQICTWWGGIFPAESIRMWYKCCDHCFECTELNYYGCGLMEYLCSDCKIKLSYYISNTTPLLQANIVNNLKYRVAYGNSHVFRHYSRCVDNCVYPMLRADSRFWLVNNREIWSRISRLTSSAWDIKTKERHWWRHNGDSDRRPLSLPLRYDLVTLCLYDDLGQINVIAGILKLRKRFRMSQILFEHGINSLPLVSFRGYGNLSTLSIAIPRLAFGRAWYCDAACG